MSISKKVLFVLFALTVFFPVAFSSTIARAQQSAYPVAAPRFDVEPATRLTAGNDLVFTLYGILGGTATVRIDGVVERFRLEEAERGVYEGLYTIKGMETGLLVPAS